MKKRLYTLIGKLDVKLLESDFTGIKTDEVVLMEERARHVEKRHTDDYNELSGLLNATITNPDEIIKDSKRKGTAYYIKFLKNDNLNVVVRVALESDKDDYKNSIITFYRMRNKNLLKLERNNKIVYKK